MRFIHVLILSSTILCASSQTCCADNLPFCSNRVINEVTARMGCTVGDTRCWLRKGGFCTDYVEKMMQRGQAGQASELKPVSSETVKKGDVALFLSRPHYAYVESVVKDKGGKPVAVSVSEYNYGTCWVDEEALVTEKYKVVSRRSNIPIRNVDGGFSRPR